MKKQSDPLRVKQRSILRYPDLRVPLCLNVLSRALRKREMASKMRLSPARRRRAVMLISRKQQQITVLGQQILPPVLRYRIASPAPDKQNGTVKPAPRVYGPVPLDKFSGGREVNSGGIFQYHVHHIGKFHLFGIGVGLHLRRTVV